MTKAKREHQPGNVGAWIEWGLATKLCQLGLKTGSDWRVMLAVLLTSSRYGGRPALLSIALLAQMTGLAPRTVQAAVTRLKASGLIVRHGRYGSLSCTLRTQGLCDATQQKPDDARGQTGETRSADMLALPKRRHGCASPNCIHVLIKDTGIEPSAFEAAFSPRQIETIGRVLEEASELLNADPSELELLDRHSSLLELPLGTTFKQALVHVCAENEKRLARDFTKAVLSLQHDERVQGEDLPL